MTDQKYKLVPVEPTEEMFRAIYHRLPTLALNVKEVHEALCAAIAAAPESNRSDWTQRVLKRLRRFEECCEDGDNDGCDIGREWFDVLTTIGALKRVQRSPAWWEITPLGESMLAAAPEPVCRWEYFTGLGYNPQCLDPAGHKSALRQKYSDDAFCPHCGRRVEVVEDE